jgi:hypothetical protein
VDGALSSSGLKMIQLDNTMIKPVYHAWKPINICVVPVCTQCCVGPPVGQNCESQKYIFETMCFLSYSFEVTKAVGYFYIRLRLCVVSYGHLVGRKVGQLAVKLRYLKCSSVSLLTGR